MSELASESSTVSELASESSTVSELASESSTQRATSRRWVGRILTAGVTTAIGVGLTAGTAAAAEAPAPAPVSNQAPALPAQVIDPDATSSARSSWESRGRPDRMAIVRPYRIDLVTTGRVTRQIGHSGGPVSISDLDRALPASWLTVTNDTATLSATVVLVRRVELELGGAGNNLRTLQLAGGASTADAASIHTGGGRVGLTGITITSVDPATGEPLPATAEGRPSIVASSGGRLEATDVTISDLGAPAPDSADVGDEGTAAVEFHTDSTGSLVRTNVTRGNVGVELSRSQGVRLEEVTVADSVEDGLVLSGDAATTMSGIRATGNGENGVLVTGVPSPRPLTGISTNNNGAFGVALVGQDGTRISGVDTLADTTGGLRLSRSTNITVNDFTATDERIGVFTHVSSSGIVLDGVRTTGGSRGLVVEKSTTGLVARNSSFSGARVAGAAINGGDISLNGVQVSDAQSGVRVERGAHDIRLTGLSVQGGRDGVVTSPGTSGVVLSDLVVNHVEDDGVRTLSPDARISGARITGGATGIDVAAGTTITDSTITAAEEGIRSRSPDQVYASQVTVDTMDLGVNNAPGSPFMLVDSSVHALESVRGEVTQQGANNVGLPPLSLLGAIGVPLIVLAVVLEELHTARQRRLLGRPRRRHPPLRA